MTESPEREASPGGPRTIAAARREAGPNERARLGRSLLFVVVVFVWLANSSGLTSSNDGSHLALARALALRGETSIDPDRSLTLEVDLAEHGGHAHSDRPPGTAFAAVAAVWIGDRLDGPLLERAIAQARAGREVKPLPGATPYLATYDKRRRPDSPRLAALIGSTIAICCHAALVGLLGLLLIDALLCRLDYDARSRLFALACLALATAWGPYATVLFSHGSAATAVAGFLLGVVMLAREDETRWWVATATGLAGAWAIACDYSLVLAIVPAAALAIAPRRYLAVLLGTAPIVLATLAYHRAAFGGVLAVGYDHQRNFGFARARESTFSGNLFEGLWTLWGLGHGAGLLARAPITLVGLGAAAWGGPKRASASPSRRAMSRALLGFVPWVLVLALHRTPWGGGTQDHRYLIPLLPFAAVGLALAWTCVGARVRALLIVMGLSSSLLVWPQFLAWHDAPAFARVGLGGGAAGVVALVAAVAFLGRKLGAPARSC
jgi:hypothetical protein